MSVDFYGPFIHDWENKIFVVEHSGNAACQISPLPGFEVEKQIRPHWRDGMGKRWDTM